ncbi:MULTISPECIES: hypothetical protein [Klebsiella]|jgi:hypothetical protein|nr:MULTISPECIES: hypothetical protein [Klebsiella]MBG8568630.1 hypothetical protein [Klebsiella michiganensis]MDV1071735.1 hypothetical protein [Klebsiella pasteurii]MDV1077579.1 hypothetical protein [Klebsiella pasteurii]HDX8828665.1 hypothetical protein [Klebsiella michiganensis]
MRYQRLSKFLAARGLSFWHLFQLACDYNERHWALYNEFNELENQQ